MTIKRGEEWGVTGEIPDGVRGVRTDHEAAELLGRGRPVRLCGGDMLRTLGGASSSGPGASAVRVPIDLLRVEYDGHEMYALSHVVLREPKRRGGAFGGELVVVMNAQFMGRLDLAPRGHPNDGRVEVLTIAESMGVRQRLAAHRRARTGTHVPHPDISTRSVSGFEEAARGRVLIVDGRRLGRVSSLAVTVEPDRGDVWF